MSLSSQTLFDSGSLRIRHLRARPDSDACGDMEEAGVDQLVLPLCGLFARHDGPRCHVIANASHALFFAAGRPYRISYPGAVGDEVLVVECSPGFWAGALEGAAGVDRVDAPSLAAQALLPPAALMERCRLQAALAAAGPGSDPLSVEESALSLLGLSLRAADGARLRRGSLAHTRRADTLLRRGRLIERVKEAVSLRPDHPWTLDELARLAGSSVYHLARAFRDEVGLPIHRYLLQLRLAAGLRSVVEGGGALTAIALDNGFASHAHFTHAFRSAFGVTPSALRRQGARAA